MVINLNFKCLFEEKRDFYYFKDVSSDLKDADQIVWQLLS